MSLDDVALVAIFNMIVSSSTLEHWWLKKGTGRSLADWG